MSTYAIGDVQGCYAELMLLLEKIKFSPAKDRLWFVGDLVNRGPKSLEVLRFIKNLGNKCVVVLGNHDLHLLAVVYGSQQYSDEDTFVDVLDADDKDELLLWLRSQKLCHYDEKLNFVMTHAGIPPQWDLATTQQCAQEVEQILQSNKHIEFFEHMYGNQPNYWNNDLLGWDRYRYITNALTRMRYCDNEGRLNLTEKGPIDNAPADLIPWFEMLNPKNKNFNIVFGHWAALMGSATEAYVAKNIFAIDTGCCWGRKLTALQLETRQLYGVASSLVKLE
ncbi:MAG: symmetrical bis(5'-nucleosyl)-tetraphosphatase [Gammaproteobacteria bacterium]|jgi:bis(5'-nucleosyl)-tetraphosphatase (symmetrical)